MKHLKNDAILFLVVIVIIAAGIMFILYQKESSKPSPTTNTTQNINDPMLEKLSQGFPDVAWGQPENINESAGPYGDMPGRKISGTTSVKQAIIPHSEDAAYLASQGFKEDSSMSADGPGGSAWGYSKTVGDNTQVIIFSYEVKPTNNNPNEPIQFNCPCDATISIFISDNPPTAQSNASLANPASVNCKDKGGITKIMNGPNGQYGLCEFTDNMACEEWAMYKGECPVGGVKTTGYDNVEQMYCAWVGGKTLAVPNAECNLPSGKVCSDSALYNGTCQG